MKIETSDKAFEKPKKDFTYLDGSKFKPEPEVKKEKPVKVLSEAEKLQNEYRALLPQVMQTGLHVKNPFDPEKDHSFFQIFEDEYIEARNVFVRNNQHREIEQHLENFKLENSLMHLVGDCERENSANSEVDLRNFATALKRFKEEYKCTDIDIMTALFFFCSKQTIHVR